MPQKRQQSGAKAKETNKRREADKADRKKRDRTRDSLKAQGLLQQVLVPVLIAFIALVAWSAPPVDHEPAFPGIKKSLVEVRPGVTLAFLDSGELEGQQRQANGSTIVLVHGFPSSASLWKPFMHQIAQETGMRVVAPFMRGYGESSRPEAI